MLHQGGRSLLLQLRHQLLLVCQLLLLLCQLLLHLLPLLLGRALPNTCRWAQREKATSQTNNSVVLALN
jgi:hypothetical protein